MNKLHRWGLKWTGPKDFVAKPMVDGYWTPWHIAQKQLEQAEAKAEMRRDALYNCAVALKEAGNLSKAMHDLIVKANESSGDAWLLRKQAEAVEAEADEWADTELTYSGRKPYRELLDSAQRLRQQADELDQADHG